MLKPDALLLISVTHWPSKDEPWRLLSYSWVGGLVLPVSDMAVTHFSRRQGRTIAIGPHRLLVLGYDARRQQSYCVRLGHLPSLLYAALYFATRPLVAAVRWLRRFREGH